jgi:hypothetical protein
MSPAQVSFVSPTGCRFSAAEYLIRQGLDYECPLGSFRIEADENMFMHNLPAALLSRVASGSAHQARIAGWTFFMRVKRKSQ